MQLGKTDIFILSVVLFGFVMFPTAHAQTNFNNFSPASPIGFQIQQFIFDIQEIITVDPEKKAELMLSHANEIQSQIDELDKNSQLIPAEYEEKRQEKLQKAQEIITNLQQTNPDQSLDALENVASKLSSLTEINEIRVLYGQFPEVLASDDEALKQEFNDKVNSLDSWNDNCFGNFDVDDYQMTNESYEKLAQKCTPLKEYSLQKVRMIVSGNA